MSGVRVSNDDETEHLLRSSSCLNLIQLRKDFLMASTRPSVVVGLGVGLRELRSQRAG